MFHHVFRCGKHQNCWKFLDLWFEFLRSNTFELSKLRSGRSNFQSSNTFVQPFAASKLFQSIFTVANLSKICIVPQSCPWNFEFTVNFRHYNKDSVHWNFQISTGNFNLYSFSFLFQVSQCLKCRKWCNSLECYIEAPHLSNFDHCSAHFGSLYLNLQTAFFLSTDWVSFA